MCLKSKCHIKPAIHKHPLEAKAVDVVEQLFYVSDGLKDNVNEGYNNGGGDAPIDIDGQQPLGDMSFEDGAQDYSFDLVALEDATK